MSRVDFYRERAKRIKDGLFNCIPLPFKRFSSYFPGLEMSKYIIVSANQKIGKSKFTDYLYVYQLIIFLLKHPEVRAKVFYFTLEMAPSIKEDEFNAFLLNYLDNIAVSPTDLRSVDNDNPINPHILDLLESPRYKPYINKYHEIVTYIDDIRHPTGIYKYCEDYALKNGHINYTTTTYIDNNGKEKFLKDKNNPYTANDSEEYRIIILDNFSNLTIESGLKKMDNIDKLSKYFIQLRDNFKYSIIAVQHQAQQQEGIENFKLGKLKPSSDGLADCKTTSRDCNTLIGLYSPFKYGFPEYEGYNIKKFKNYIRFMEVLEDRDYGSNGQICPLFFNGATAMFKELPLPTENMDKIYSYIESLEKNKIKSSTPNKLFTIILNKFK